jgi:glyoxylase-like metal-dependent hydrolase (beta-lactamase superfamily II)
MEIIEEKNIRCYRCGGVRVYRIPVECYPSHITNVYLVIDRLSFLVDTGIDSKRGNKILANGFETIQKEFHETITFKEVKNIVITHGHVDHFGMLGNEEFKEKNVYVHKADSEYI